MFVFNLNAKKYFKFFFVIAFILVFLLMIFSCYKLYKEAKRKNEVFRINDDSCIEKADYPEIEPNNYSNVLKEVHNNPKEYVDKKISFTGYVYRVKGLADNQFILARDMIYDNNTKSVVIGFLSEYDRSNQLNNGDWIKVYAKIEIGNFNR